MKLKGYIKPLKENSFTIPIYGSGTDNYLHHITSDFRIISFYKTEISNKYFVENPLPKVFKLNSTAALAFVGQDSYHLLGSADLVIDEIILYLKNSTSINEFLNIKKEAATIKKLLLNYKLSIDEISTSDLYVQQKSNKEESFTTLDIKSEGIIVHTLDEYLNFEGSIIHNKGIVNTKENIIKRQIENSLVDDKLFIKNRETIFYLFRNYLLNNDLDFKNLLLNTEIGKNFISYLGEKSESLNLFESSFEETELTKSDERRKKLKEFNYQFHNNIDNSKKNTTENFIILIDGKMIMEEIKQEKTNK